MVVIGEAVRTRAFMRGKRGTLGTMTLTLPSLAACERAGLVRTTVRVRVCRMMGRGTSTQAQIRREREVEAGRARG